MTYTTETTLSNGTKYIYTWDSELSYPIDIEVIQIYSLNDVSKTWDN